ncbi:hypothetical protein Acsp04_42360 [Actinomadura sp. NBRC 104425]|uniref:DUF397 domain-containing protein n=1 Tax=Actinomadura sp. NBRC 104425 TaxID=3032204 RepID=UPI0024A199B9|nr:DUF397 domain-containing protein [Actinomadura sp. NBRC 104425]GLZ14001.1 hypothetical protein Acsp04_42360 [Actinomadura sp. NBRC 104425]
MKVSDLKAAAWRKSSYSLPTQSDCVEVARVGAVNAVRDSKDPEGAFLIVTRSAWSGLLSQIKQGAYDL